MAKFKIVWSYNARNDLLKLLEFYIERNKTNTYSRKLNNQINSRIRLLRMYPKLGTKTNLDSVRFLTFDNFQVIYEIMGNVILIIMIWDTYQNPEKKARQIHKRRKNRP